MLSTCPHCGKQIKIPDEYKGKSVKCPNCGQKSEPADIPDVTVESPPQKSRMKKQSNYLQKFGAIIMCLSIIGLLISVKYPVPTLWYSTSVSYHAAVDFFSVFLWRLILLFISVQGFFAGLILWAIGAALKNQLK